MENDTTMLQSRTIRSIADFTRFLAELGDFVLFRGQNRDFPLLPKIARVNTHRPVLEAEKLIFRTFREQSILYLPQRPESLWDWLALAQHYGLPTRLLDWTTNPLAALWFAVATPTEARRPGIVWTFTPDEEDFIAPSDEPFTGRRTKLFRPRHVTERIRVQSGLFTVHKHTRDGFIPFERLKPYKPKLVKLIVPASSFSELRYSLDRFGVNQATLFPDLEGLCRNIAWLNTYLADEKELDSRRKRRLHPSTD